MTLKRIALSGTLVALALGGIVGLAGFGWGGHHDQKFMKRMVDAHLADVFDELNATADQRSQMTVLEDKLLADVQALRQTRGSLMKQLAETFPSDQLDTAALDRSAEPMKQAQQKLQEDLRQTVIDLHGLLTPAQRQKLSERVQEHQDKE